jgi:hypothetical protein
MKHIEIKYVEFIDSVTVFSIDNVLTVGELPHTYLRMFPHMYKDGQCIMIFETPTQVTKVPFEPCIAYTISEFRNIVELMKTCGNILWNCNVLEKCSLPIQTIKI